MMLRPLTVVAGFTLMLACASGRHDGAADGGRFPAWPTGDPRVRWVESLETARDLGRPGFFKRLTGQTPSPIFERPYGVAWFGDDLIVSDPGAGSILKITAKGKMSKTRPGLFEGPIGVTACLNGIVVADGRAGRVGLLDDELRLVRWLAEDLERPTGVACVADGVAVVETAAHRLVLLDDDGSRRALGERGDGDGQFNFPAAITSSGETLWVGDTLNFRVLEIDPDTGLFAASFGALGDSAGETPRIKGLAVDTNGRVWISDAHLDLIALFDPAGVFLMEIGGPGQADGQFSFPAGIAIRADGRVAVADSLNRRIQILQMTDEDEIADREGQ